MSDDFGENDDEFENDSSGDWGDLLDMDLFDENQKKKELTLQLNSTMEYRQAVTKQKNIELTFPDFGMCYSMRIITTTK